jgi:hypothetical protein
VEIDGVPVHVTVRERRKDANEGDVCSAGTGEGCPLCSRGTWTVFKFDNPEIRKRKDYKKVWRAVFFALKLNHNDESHGLQTDPPANAPKALLYEEQLASLNHDAADDDLPF